MMRVRLTCFGRPSFAAKTMFSGKKATDPQSNLFTDSDESALTHYSPQS